MKRVKLHVPHPTVKPEHVKHTAASLTILGGIAAYYPPLHLLEGFCFTIAGCIAIYEPHFITHHIDVELKDDQA